MSYWYARSWYTRSLTAFVTLSFILPASAQSGPPVASPVSAASPSVSSGNPPCLDLYIWSAVSSASKSASALVTFRS